MQIVEETVGKPVDPAVQLQVLPLFPGVLDETGFFDMTGLTKNVEFAKEVFFSRLVQTLEALGLATVNAAYVAKPIVD